MKVCDRCKDPKTDGLTQEVHIILEDNWFDLCEKHMQELMEFLTTKEKPKRKRRLKNTARAA